MKSPDSLPVSRESPETTQKVNDMKLTDAFAAQAQSPEKEFVLHRDDDQPGFALKVRASGQKSWVYEARVFGKFYRRTIGPTNVYTAKAARMIAREIAGELRQGIDRHAVARDRVSEERAATAQRLAEELSPYLDTAADDYIAKAKIKEGTRSYYQGLKDRELAKWHNVKIKDINKDLVVSIFETISQDISPVRATKAVKFISTICTSNGLDKPIPDNFKFPKPKVRQARLEPQDGINVYAQLQKLAKSRKRAFLTLLLMTGCRAGEAERLTGNDINLETSVITLVDTKNGTDHKIYATPDLIAELRPYINGNEPLFGGAAKDGNVNKFCRHIEGVPAFSNHDLRKCFAITAIELGIPYPVIKRALNHSSGDVTLTHYAQATPSQLRSCWERVAQFYKGEGNVNERTSPAAVQLAA